MSLREILTEMENHPTANLEGADSRRIRVTLSRMPYGGAVTRSHMDVKTVADLTEYLAQLVDVLTREAERARETERELNNLQHDVAAMRRVFGLSEAGS